MANSLLDFVMSVVRDPDAAARFAADPDQAILDANLTDVTSADVNALIPVVSESMTSLDGLPVAGLDGGVAETAGNVWTSGAATAAFDAFGDQVPAEALDDIHGAATEVINDPGAGLDALADPGVPDVATVDDASLHLDQPVIDDASADEPGPVEDWSDSLVDIQQLDTDAGGFDIFD
ncbi:Rv0340 family IniB-related protein [Mycobacterium sp. IDR2000157661]|uniref:Rv0340 family IniB-related protein n=1 Tax=Mycobacterium sp. IDR2000157661 TaxID=2867005 RepID=UPI001EEC146D|nr:Rv0340 family IniB-related protein [Mycobacterium sp. IDR2000157661]ULE34347.1 Rv0340 family protein [Mycobacterium sp. IDR2000157661]